MTRSTAPLAAGAGYFVVCKAPAGYPPEVYGPCESPDEAERLRVQLDRGFCLESYPPEILGTHTHEVEARFDGDD